MSEVRYSQEHEWVRLTGDHEAEVGISDHAQEALGDIVFVELPKIGKNVKAGDICGVVESVKTASDVFCPLTGEVSALNTALEENPALINTDPETKAWFFKLKNIDKAEFDRLMSEEDYKVFIGKGA